MADYGTLADVKRKVKINTGATEADDELNDYLEDADEFINTRVTLMNETAPITGDEELNSLGTKLAAAYYNYWTSPVKDLESSKYFEKKVIDHLRAKFTGTMEEGITQNTFSKTSSRILGTE